MPCGNGLCLFFFGQRLALHHGAWHNGGMNAEGITAAALELLTTLRLCPSDQHTLDACKVFGDNVVAAAAAKAAPPAAAKPPTASASKKKEELSSSSLSSSAASAASSAESSHGAASGDKRTP